LFVVTSHRHLACINGDRAAGTGEMVAGVPAGAVRQKAGE